MSDSELFPDFEFTQKPKLDPKEQDSVSQLYRLVAEVRKLEPWKFLANEDLIGINYTDDPQQLHLVSILGNAGEYLAFQLHFPPRGLRFYNAILEDDEAEPGPGMQNLHFIDCEFVNNNGADPRDLMAFGVYGTQTKRHNSIPSLRSYSPGFLPWYLDDKDVAAFLPALRLFLHHYEKIAANIDKFFSWPEKDAMPTIPVLTLKEGADPDRMENWEIKCRQIPIGDEPAAVEPASDGFESVYEERQVAEEIWEIACTFLPDAVDPEEGSNRPYFPKVVGAMHDDSAGMVLVEPEIYAGHLQSDAEAVQKFFKKFSDARKCLPKEIRVTSETERLALQGIADRIGIKVSVEKLLHLSDFFDSFSGGLDVDMDEQIEELLSILPPGDPIRKMINEGRYEEAFEALAVIAEENADNVIVGDFGGEN